MAGGNVGGSLGETQAWLEGRYLEAGLAVPAFRPVLREDALTGTSEPSGALIVEDPDLRLYLLLLDLEGERGAEAIAARVRADLEVAGALCAACQPAEGPGLPGPASAWRVQVYWVGRADQQQAWRAALLHVRQTSGILEEIPVNAAFRAEGERLAQGLDRAGIPCLLLLTRSVFRKDAAATEQWHSADRRVREALVDLEAAFLHLRPRGIARELMDLAAQEVPDLTPAAGLRPRGLASLGVRNVRGIRDLTLTPWPGGGPAQAWVVSGPNGSGKSSLAEAASLRAFGTSPGLCSYLRDADVNRARNPEGYLANYVTPLDGGLPLCGFDGAPAPFRLAPDLPAALEALAEADGTLVPQGGAPGFLDIPGEALGARMARSFSALASRLGAHVEAGRQAAGEARTALARRHGISPSTRLLSSFQEKIAHAILAPAFAPLPASAAAWVACRQALPGGGEARTLAAAWAPGETLAETVKRVLRPGPREADLEGVLLPIFGAQDARARAFQEQAAAFRAKVAGLPAPAGLADQATQWASWLAAGPQAPTAPAPPPSPELAALLAERAAVAEEGRQRRPHRDHLAATLAFIQAHWQGHSQDCPTCGAQAGAPVAEVVAGLLAAEEARLEAAREAYAALTVRIRALEPGPASGPACPAGPEARRQLQAATEALLGPGVEAEALLRDGATRPALLKLLAMAETPQLLDLPVPAAGPAAAAAARAIAQAWREAELTLAEPEAWEEVAKELTRRLAQVVEAHLPATLEGLWRELAGCLSPAPWLLPAPPRFQPRTRRGANEVSVVFEAPDGQPRLARHLLNDAQRDTLGLAWTFCQHLAKARFRHAWMLLDDPAQDLDEPAFRALCRFLATLVTLYERAGLPFTLVLLLNQEDRALHAARETSQGLILLGWTAAQEDAAVRRVTLFGEGTRSPQPADVFARAEGA